MFSRHFHLIIFLALFIIVGCSGDDSADMDSSDRGAGFVEEETSDMADSVVEEDEIEEEASSEDVTEVEMSDQMIIYNGDISIEVDQFDEAQSQIEEHVEEMGGYIVESTIHDRDTEDRSATFSVRIPQENFTPFLNELESTSTNVLERSTYGDDVTEEYVDLESRLRSQEAVEERLLTFMDDAENTEDLLAISGDLASTQEEIEQIEGRMNYLENHVAYSTVDIHVQEVAASTLQDQGSLNTWGQATSLFTDTINVLISFFSGLVIFTIGLSPVLVPLLVAGGVLLIFLRKKKNVFGRKSKDQ